MFKDSEPLNPFYEATKKVFTARFGHDFSSALLEETRQAYEGLRPEIPYIGGKGNLFTEWLNYGAFYLAICRAFSAHGHSFNDVGKIIFETYEVMADYPERFLGIALIFVKHDEKKL